MTMLAGHDHPDPLLDGILYIGPLSHLHSLQGPTCGTILQPSYLVHSRLVGCLVWTVHGAFYVH
jgi:hypothetical protein